MLARGGDGVWRGTFAVPAGAFSYKAALDGAWNVNYGLGGLANGPNIPFTTAGVAPVRFYYDETTHWVTDSVGSTIVSAPGSYQSEIGCPGDWDPGCLRSWLEDPDGDGVYTFQTTAIPAGTYETKAAIDESWNENYGDGGTPNGSNIPFTVPADATTTFSYAAATHVLTVTSVAPDTTGPAITCSATPTFLLRATGAVVGARATDAGSGPAVVDLAVPADTSAVGLHLASVTAVDLAGNPTTAACPYTVVYAIRVVSPGASVERGAAFAVRFALVDAAGARIATGEARAIASRCAATLTIDGVRPARPCFGYDRGSRTFRSDVPGRPRLSRGVHLLAIAVLAADGTTAGDAVIPVTVR
jgi:hypothetical protein